MPNIKKFVTSKKVNISVSVNGKSAMYALRSGATLAWDESSRAFKVEKPSSIEEENVLINEKTFNSLRDMNCVVNAGLQSEIKGLTKGSGVEQEQKIIKLATENAALREDIEELQKQLQMANDTISTLTAAASTVPAGNLDDSSDDEESEDDESNEDESLPNSEITIEPDTDSTSRKSKSRR